MDQDKKTAYTAYFMAGFKKIEELNINEDMTDEEIIKLIRKCRLTDLSDGLDAIGLVNTGTMSTEMRPIRSAISFAGFAYTVKFVPTQKHSNNFENNAQYFTEGLRNYLGGEFDYLSHIAKEPLKDKVLVFDAGGYPAGIVGSENSMGWTEQGVSGIVIDGGVRDSYECNLEGMNICATKRTFNHYYGRLECVSTQGPVTCAGVCVRPGDIVCADDDGVLVIPRKSAVRVLKVAVQIRIFDMIIRAQHYKNLGKEVDETLSVEF